MNRERSLFLQKLYEVTKGSQTRFVSMWDIGEVLEFTREETKLVTDILKGLGLIEYRTLGGGISITVEGVIKAETLTNNCDNGIDVAPYNNSVINNFYGDINNNQLQQNTSDSTQIRTNVENLNQNQIKELDSLLKTIKTNIQEINELSSPDRSVINEKIQEIEHYKKSNTLVKNVLKESLGTIRNVLEGVTGSIIASGIMYQLGLFADKL